jgi:branched-subunit amino acid transport protein
VAIDPCGNGAMECAGSRFYPGARLEALAPARAAGKIVRRRETVEAAAWTSPKVLAALLAGAAAFLTHSTLKTSGAGMAALWPLQWLRP